MDAKELFMNGEFVPAGQGVVPVRSHGFAYGTGCFEGIRGYWNEEHRQIYLFRLREHYERLLRSCKILQIKLPYSVDDLIAISTELVRRNDQHQNVYLRPVAYKGDETLGVRLHGLRDDFIITSEPVGDYVDTHGLRCGVSSWRRVDDNAIPARAKIIGSYVNSALAKSEAIQNGFDEAIMLNHDGHVSEGSAENIFLVFNGELVTPSPTENILLGVTRNTIMQLARRELGLITRERQVDRTELYIADEIFLCGTGAQIAPVIEVDHRPVGTGKIGPIGEAIQSLYFDIVRGRRQEYRAEWCTPVYASATSEQRNVPQHSEVS
ncbi:MAG TPA: branched-chain amino acid transaminase [Ktedonobacteraceae bacterium]|nr:branched-chain amino acid transaminase [Ktedonobacteraceae bacterium]